MKIVIVRLDLDRYDLEGLSTLVCDGVITIPDAREARAVRELPEYEELMWVRNLQAHMKVFGLPKVG